MVELAFVLAEGQNLFFAEVVEAIRYELDAMGVPSSLHKRTLPDARDGRVNVLVPPHEYFQLTSQAQRPTAAQLRRTIFICMEQPHTPFFFQNTRLAPRAGAVFDISATAVRAYRGMGIPARHLQLGYSGYWDTSTVAADRDIDVLFMGSASERRERHLSSSAVALQDHRFHVILSDNSRPNARDAPNFLTGQAKRQMLARSRTLMNIHQGDEQYFEWVRGTEAVHARCLLVTETSADHLPLQPGAHFVQGPPETLPELARTVLHDQARREEMTEEAHAFLRTRLPFQAAVAQLAEIAARLDGGAPVQGTERRASASVVRGRAQRARSRARWFAREMVLQFGGEASAQLKSETSGARQRLMSAKMDLLEQRRELRQVAVTSVGDAPSLVRVHATAAHAVAVPQVSVVIPVFNHGRYCLEALESLRRSSFSRWEAILVDDGSVDDSLELVARWAHEHDELPIQIWSHRINQGLAATRNDGIERSRGTYVFLLDGDNLLLRHGLSRLVAALEAEPAAWFAYGILAAFPERSTSGWLVSKFPWDPEKLRRGNYIDAMALFRKQVLTSLGGYTADPRLYGWEDYDVYCRIAERGGGGAFVAEPVGAYRVTPGSMIASSHVFLSSAHEALRERAPLLMGSSR